MKYYEEVDSEAGVVCKARKAIFEKYLVGYIRDEAHKKKKEKDSDAKGKKKVKSVPYQWTQMHNMEAKILELASMRLSDFILLYRFLWLFHNREISNLLDFDALGFHSRTSLLLLLFSY